MFVKSLTFCGLFFVTPVLIPNQAVAANTNSAPAVQDKSTTEAPAPAAKPPTPKTTTGQTEKSSKPAIKSSKKPNPKPSDKSASQPAVKKEGRGDAPRHEHRSSQANLVQNVGDVLAMKNPYFQKGMIELDAGRNDGALKLLEKAIDHQPRNAAVRCAMGIACLRGLRPSEGWQHLRLAVRLDQSHAPSADMFSRVWRYFDSKGLHNVGTSTRLVEQAMGKPDRVLKRDNRTRWDYGFMALEFEDDLVHATVDLRRLQARRAPSDRMTLHLDDRAWNLNHRSVNRDQVLVEYVPPRQTVQNWTELASVQRFHAKANRTVKAMMLQIKKHILRDFPDAHFAVLRDEPGDVLYEWRIGGNAQQAAQHEIARLVQGSVDVHRIAYVAKVPKLPTGVRQKWSHLIGDAKLVKE